VQSPAPASSAPHVSSLTSSEPSGPEQSWWDGEEREQAALDDMKQEMRDRRALGEPDLPPWDEKDAWLLRSDTPEERRKLQRLKAYRESGYNGPLDRDNNIPDPDDPAEQDVLETLASLSLTHG
jgi:hypothetical protein